MADQDGQIGSTSYGNDLDGRPTTNGLDASGRQNASLGETVDNSEPQILLILVGLPGSGKSTFAQALVEVSRNQAGSHPRPNTLQSATSRQWIRASQDDAPNRRRQECEAVVTQGLAAGSSVIVDRVDFDPTSHFINIGYSNQPRPRIWGLIFDVDYPTLEARLRSRETHPSITDFETGIRVLGQMKATWSPPRTDSTEGFDRIYTLPESDQPNGGVWTEELLQGVLHQIEKEGLREVGERVVIPKPVWPGGYRGRGGGDRGRWRGGYDGRGRGRGWHQSGPYPPNNSQQQHHQQTYPNSSSYRPPNPCGGHIYSERPLHGYPLGAEYGNQQSYTNPRYPPSRHPGQYQEHYAGAGDPHQQKQYPPPR